MIESLPWCTNEADPLKWYFLHSYFTLSTFPDCDPLALGTPLLASSTVCRRAESGLRTEHGTVCYTGRMQGAHTYYSCDAGYQLSSGEHGESLRVCQGNGSWNDTATICVPLEGITHIKSLFNDCCIQQ